MHVSIFGSFLNHIHFDLSKSLKDKYDRGIRLTIYDFLLVFNSNIWASNYTCMSNDMPDYMSDDECKMEHVMSHTV